MSTLPKVYIDGHVGTTGLRIREWLAPRQDIELMTIPEEVRKDNDARREHMLASDITVFCLPDDAAREAAAWVRESDTRLIDASTAHRVNPDWVYGLPELEPGQRDAIRNAKLVSNPGCYSSSFILLTRPLIDAGVIAPDAPISIHALSGHSGGGRSLMERWEDPANALSTLPYEAPYAIDKVHKHIPEMTKYSGMVHEPQFEPAVGPFRCGMRVQVPLHASLLNGHSSDAWEVLNDRYAGEPFVKVMPRLEPGTIEEKSFNPQACNDTNGLQIHVVPHPSGHVILMAILDNLGKGASGMAIQNLNLMLGFAETTGLPLTANAK
ncbi:MAG: N-acetyl-gamma-glutamyl-phosphate reductase [Caldilineaceae bacterium]|nr:N-acetyl-gamma-glutamyl-phosphate reductase [Caldilineaceae bacterium]